MTDLPMIRTAYRRSALTPDKLAVSDAMNDRHLPPYKRDANTPCTEWNQLFSGFLMLFLRKSLPTGKS